MISAGIDLGSREVKLAVLQDDNIIRLEKWGTLSFYREFCSYQDKLNVDLVKLNLSDSDVMISTGYGRNNIDLADFTPINELKAHTYGALFQSGKRDFVLLDIGGQDIKVMKIQDGVLTDLVLNDKCAASCGRYLENMASVLEIDLEEMGKYSREPAVLNSTCAVFSESELIGRIAEGVPFPSLCAGVNHSLYKRLHPLVAGFNPNLLLVSGGVSQNKALIKFLNEDCETVEIVENAQYNGAIGAAIYGARSHEQRRD